MPLLVKISDGAVAISRLFNNGLLFEIHPPQRRFKWNKPQIDQLWTDITKAQSDKRDSYFLGTLLLAPTGPGKVSVIDGQQRLTTLSLLLAVLRDQCWEFPDLQERARGIQRLIARVDHDGRPVGALVVTLQEADNGVYVRLAKEHGATSGPIAARGRLQSAVKRLKEHVLNHINVPDPKESLRDLCEYVQSNLRFLPIEVQSEGDAYLVFDTTNTRGLRLTTSEALKARLATIAREDRDLADYLIKKWNEVASNLEARIGFTDPKAEAIDAMDDYLHSIWSAKEGYAAKRTLDRQIASKLKNPALIRQFVEDLETYLDSYLAVRAPSGKSWLNEDLKDLRNLNKQSFCFLTMVQKHAANRFEEAVSLTLSLQIRNITIGPQQANVFEKDWPEWAILVREGQTDLAFDQIRSQMIDDEDFKSRFADEAVVSPSTARHLLRRLDHTSRPGSGVQPMDVELEHILPKSVVGQLTDGKSLTKNVRQWIKDLGYKVPGTPEGRLKLGEELTSSLNVLGNQALLNFVENRRARDLPFADKKNLYRKQDIELTKALTTRMRWGPSQIRARQKKLASRAVQTWPR